MNVLLVDDRPANLLALEAALEDLGHNLVKAPSGEEALRLLLDCDFAVVLLDVQMHGLDGFETAKLIRNRGRSRHTPIIFVTAHESDRFPVERAYSLGAVDYLVKPLVPVILRAKVAGFVELFQKTQQVQRQAELLRRAERREFDRSQREQREWFRVTLASIGDAVITTDTEGRVTFLNPVAQALTGWGEEAAGHPLEKIFPIINEHSRQPAENPAARVLREGVVVGLANHTVLIAKDGTERPIDDSAAPIRDERGHVVGVVLVFRDVTERREAEGRLRRSEQELADFFENAAVGLHWVGPDGTILRANQAELDLLGYAREEYVGHHIAEFHADPDVIEDILRRLQAGETLRRYGARLRCKDGSTKHVLIESNVLREGGRFVHTRCFTRDVTEQVVAERALRESEERFRQLAENIREVFWMSDPRKDEVLYVSPAYEEVWGRPCQSLYDQPRSFFEAIHPEDQEGVRAAALDRQSRGEPSDVEYRVVRPDRSVRWVRDRSFPIKDRSGSVYRVAGIAEDITERKKAEQDLRMQARVLESMAEGVSVADESGVILYTNPAEDRMFGYGRGEMLGQPVTVMNDYPPEENARRVGEAIEQLKTKGAWLGEWDNRRKDGTPFTTYARITALETGGRRYFVCVHEDVTERKKARVALEESEQRFRGLMEQAPFSVQVFASDGRTVRVNRAWEELWGVSLDQVADYNILEDRQLEAKGVLPLIRRAFAGEPVEIPAIEYDPNETIPDRTRHQDPRRWVAAVAYPLRDLDGRVREVVLVHEDRTARMQAEEAVRESEERLRLALEAGRMGVWDWNIRTNEIKWSENLEPVHGLAPGTFGGTLEAFQKLIHAEDRQLVNRAIARAVEERSSYDIEFRNVWPDASVHWMSGKGRVFTGDDGQPARMIGVGMDITQRKRAEQDTQFLADASAALAGLVDYGSTLQKVARLAVPHFADWATVDVLDEGGGLRRLAVAHVDPPKVELAHDLHRRYPPDPAAPQGVWNVVRTGKAEIIPEITDELLAATVKDHERLRIVRELGLRSYMGVPLTVRGKVLGVITFIAAESGRRYDAADLAVAEDLAHRAAVAIENARLYHEVREADRKKDEFLAVLGHELRNPLAPISNALQVLKMPGANGQVVEQAREMMERQVQHMVRLVDDLLDVSRIVRGKVELRKEPVELATVVARAVETSQPLVEAEGHELTVALPPEPLRVSGDPVRLAQAVGNLLNNAARYTERGGKIRVEVERVGDRAVLRVRDTGIGIAPDVLPRIWEMFVQADRRTKASQGGMGVGLALVRGLVELHGGTVEARSEGPGKGSEFAVALPLLSPQEPDERQSQEGGRSPQAAPRRVLVVDDNVDAAESLAMLLRLGGHEVRVAYDGPSALRLAEAEPPEVAFFDIGMPVMDGYELARRFRVRHALQNVLLVALTGWGQEEDRRRTKEAGFEAHEVKPVSPEALDKILSHPKLARRQQ